ncbi:MAG: hypothetical protein QM523_01190 [Candidatus Pacebacteria bacterium]|nr:hypothetical protein [Candidatus Paceibacterota bacterium]
MITLNSPATPPATLHPDPISCPGCGLACDDLSWNDGHVDSRGCPIAADYFKPSHAAPMPHLFEGKPIDLNSALDFAASLIKVARMPIFIGGGCDIAGVQSLLALADSIGGVVDSRSRILPINMQVMQENGWIATTFSEVYNRADLVILIGGNPLPNWPRLLSRLVANHDSMFRTRPPQVLQLGTAIPPEQLPQGLDYQAITVEPSEILNTLSALTAHLKGGAWREASPVHPELLQLAERIKSAHYPVVIWDAANLCPTATESILAIDYLGEVIRLLTPSQRIVGLPLSSSDNAGGMASVMTWQTGFPNRLFYTPEGPESHRYRDQGLERVADGDADLLVWVSAITPYPMPEFKGQIIAIVGDDYPESELTRATVTLRVGRIGIDHGGEVGRSDSVVMIPVPAAFPTASTTERPRVDLVFNQILARLERSQGAIL